MDEATLRQKLDAHSAKRKDENGRLVGFGLFVTLVLLVVVMVIALGEKQSINSSDSLKPAPETVSASPWDGSVVQVVRYLKNNLKDPDSYKGIRWGPVSKKDGKFMVVHEYRAKNSFGGYTVETQLFTLDPSGRVISAD